MLGESSHFTDFINLDAQVKWQEGLEDHQAPRIPKSLALHPPQRRINTDATLVLQCCCPSTCLIIMQGGYQNSFSFFIEMSNNAAFSGKLRRRSRMPRFCALLSTLPALEDLQLLCTISAIGITAWTMDILVLRLILPSFHFSLSNLHCRAALAKVVAVDDPLLSFDYLLPVV